MIILAIETSCDDTCIAMLEIRNWQLEILSNIVSSQVKIHAQYGGVYPFLAKREHQKNLPVVFEKALKGAKLLLEKIDLVAVTVGPGLEPCLWQGVNFAKDLAKSLNLPIIPVNHIEAHIAANWLSPIGGNSKFQIPNSKQIPKSEIQNPKLFPAVCLVVSGGHTQLILMKNLGEYRILGETRDDAAGECLDKAARILGLGYPGGPAIAAEAAKFKISNLKFKIGLPRPMIYQKNYDFSFSGLKTAVLYLVKQLTISNQQLTIKQKREICAETQQAIIDVLIHKTLKAAKDYRAKSIILGGGVVANDELRKQFNYQLKTKNYQLKFLVPQKIYCTDNAAMVALVAYFHYLKRDYYPPTTLPLKRAPKYNLEKMKANANLRLGKNYGTTKNLRAQKSRR